MSGSGVVQFRTRIQTLKQSSPAARAAKNAVAGCSVAWQRCSAEQKKGWGLMANRETTAGYVGRNTARSSVQLFNQYNWLHGFCKSAYQQLDPPRGDMPTREARVTVANINQPLEAYPYLQIVVKNFNIGDDGLISTALWVSSRSRPTPNDFGNAVKLVGTVGHQDGPQGEEITFPVMQFRQGRYVVGQFVLVRWRYITRGFMSDNFIRIHQLTTP